MTIRSRDLYRSSLLTVRDMRCRPETLACGCEECSTRHALVFARRGAFVFHDGNKRTVMDANHVAFFNAVQPRRISHLDVAGDDCTALSFSDEAFDETVAAAGIPAAERRHRPFPIRTAPIAPELALQSSDLLRRACGRRRHGSESRRARLGSVVSGAVLDPGPSGEDCGEFCPAVKPYAGSCRCRPGIRRGAAVRELDAQQSRPRRRQLALSSAAGVPRRNRLDHPPVPDAAPALRSRARHPGRLRRSHRLGARLRLFQPQPFHRCLPPPVRHGAVRAPRPGQPRSAGASAQEFDSDPQLHPIISRK